MSKTQRRELVMIIIGAVLLGIAVLVANRFDTLPVWALLIIYLVPYLILGLPVLIDAVHGLRSGQFMDENFLMSVASIGAICVGEYPEAVLIMLLYSIGELLQSVAVGKSRRSIAALMDIRPDSANLETADGLLKVAPEKVKIGETILVKAGERVPLDGMVIEGSSSLNTAALTGESLPRDVSVGDTASAGCINIQGTLRLKVEKEYADSTVARMLELIEDAAANKSKSENFITKFARWYTPSVIGLVVLLAIIPPLFFGQDWNVWVYRALTFLVISCPCALVISVPLTFFAGIGGAGGRGVLVKGSNYMETLAKCGTAVFDKTGTLTKGSFSITKLLPVEGITEQELLMYAAACERFSTHPLAKCICNTYGIDRIPDSTDASELAGKGVCAKLDGRTIHAGNGKLMELVGASYADGGNAGTIVYVALDGKYIGSIEISDEIKDDASQMVADLKQKGIRTVMLTGDRRSIGQSTAATLGIDEVHSELLPTDKVSCLESIVNSPDRTGTVVFVGDGINDAPVLARADVGIAMGGLGSDAAIEASDIVIMDDKLDKLPYAINIAKRTVGIAKGNIILALSIKLLVLILGALGYAQMWMALVADVGVCLVAILNAMRAMRPGRK